jgi:hypothetical protein
MRDHNETHESPEHREHPNNPDHTMFSPWGGDNLEECEEHPCEPAPPAVDELSTPELLLLSDASWGWTALWSRI